PPENCPVFRSPFTIDRTNLSEVQRGMSYLTGQGIAGRAAVHPAREMSCPQFALAMDELLRTGRVTAVPMTGELNAGQLARLTGRGPFVPVADAAALRAQLGNVEGRTGVLFVRNGVEIGGNRYTQHGVGHYVNVQVRNGQVYVFDPQYGDIYDRAIDVWTHIGP